ncbi:DJ-1/PfpI family protein [Paenibacillus sp. CF384]|uniref:DJ-1/PfpI family protein n=1 Tax=Paenibacillus sp. CF384 TaxID=1884382 RepID=UPI00089B3C8B|nr:DJ-1/PfpI family protein [Paenibacillus sp. CF384]SDX05548.1 DJ-1/PfpI family protein [Paenibacillus sp. CF384]
MKNIAILLFDDITLLDFAGPFEVFSEANRMNDINIFTVAEVLKPITSNGNLSINPHYCFSNCPKLDILLIPGGIGTRREMDNYRLLEWIKGMHNEVEQLLSVCSGALLLAKADLLEGLKVTTHHNVFDLLEDFVPSSTIVERNKRYIDNGKIIMSAGVSAGIDMSLYIVEKIFGRERALVTASGMEYDWNEIIVN